MNALNFNLVFLISLTIGSLLSTLFVTLFTRTSQTLQPVPVRSEQETRNSERYL